MSTPHQRRAAPPVGAQCASSPSAWAQRLAFVAAMAIPLASCWPWSGSARPISEAEAIEAEAARAEEGRRAARGLTMEANALYRGGRFAEAAARFEEAYALVPRLELQYNLARCWEQAGEIHRARAAYEAVLAAPEGEASPPMVDLARRGLARLDAAAE